MAKAINIMKYMLKSHGEAVEREADAKTNGAALAHFGGETILKAMPGWFDSHPAGCQWCAVDMKLYEIYLVELDVWQKGLLAAQNAGNAYSVAKPIKPPKDCPILADMLLTTQHMRKASDRLGGK